MDSETMAYYTINLNSFSDAPSLQIILEQPLEKKSGGCTGVYVHMCVPTRMGPFTRVATVGCVLCLRTRWHTRAHPQACATARPAAAASSTSSTT